MAKRYYYLSKDYYKRRIKYKKLISVSFLGIVLLNIMALWLIVEGIVYIKESNFFRGFAILFLIVPSLFVLTYIFIALIVPLKYLDDIFITEEGINLPFPYDRKTKENFVNYDDIKKIIVYINNKDVYLSLIHIHLNKEVKPWLPVGSRYIIGFSGVDPYKFVKGIREANGNKISIEFKSWEDLSKRKIE